MRVFPLAVVRVGTGALTGGLALILVGLSLAFGGADHASANHVIPGSSLTTLYIQEDRFYNWDFSSPTVIGNHTVDWPITMLFLDNAEIDKIKNVLGLGRCGSAAYAWLKDSTGTPLDRDADGGITSDCVNCSGTRNHMRLYADADDRLYNLSWGFYVLGTTHQDHNNFPNCLDHDWSGETEDAQSFFTTRAAEKWGWPSVCNNCVNFWNPVSPFISPDGEHRVESDGRATYVWAAVDLAVWRPWGGSSSGWHIRGMGLQTLSGPGAPDRVPVPADVAGDGGAELVEWQRSNGTWYVKVINTGQQFSVQWGQEGDTPVPCDYNGDGKDEYAVFRPTYNPGYQWWQASWYVLGGVSNYHWGDNGDVPVPADYTGDGRCDYAVWRPSNGTWYVKDSATGSEFWQQWGEGEDADNRQDVPVPADYNCDGRAEYAVFRTYHSYQTALAYWFVFDGVQWLQWGERGDTPVPRDYDGRGCGDFAVWRPGTSGYFYIKDRYNAQLGSSIDTAVPEEYAPSNQ